MVYDFFMGFNYLMLIFACRWLSSSLPAIESLSKFYAITCLLVVMQLTSMFWKERNRLSVST